MASDSGVKKDALGISGTATGQAGTAYSSAMPLYQQLATGTDGMTPQQMADARTSFMQTAGGGVSAATGEGNLDAARTGEAGGYAAALDSAARSAGVTQSQGDLQLTNQNSDIARQNQRLGLAGEQGIYDTASGTSVSALNTANQAAKPFWQQLLMQGVQSGGQVASAYLGG